MCAQLFSRRSSEQQHLMTPLPRNLEAAPFKGVHSLLFYSSHCREAYWLTTCQTFVISHNFKKKTDNRIKVHANHKYYAFCKKYVCQGIILLFAYYNQKYTKQHSFYLYVNKILYVYNIFKLNVNVHLCSCLF